MQTTARRRVDLAVLGVGGLIVGLTPMTVGRLRVLLPTKPNPLIQRPPEAHGGQMTFRQTAGNRPGFSFLAASTRWPALTTHGGHTWPTHAAV